MSDNEFWLMYYLFGMVICCCGRSPSDRVFGMVIAVVGIAAKIAGWGHA